MACAAAALAAAPSSVAAQSVGAQFARNKAVDVRARPRPGYQAVGKQLGSFTVYPKVTLSVVSDDNVYAQSANPDDDIIASLIAEAAGYTDWTNHELRLNASVKRDEYSKLDKESNTSWTVGAGGRFDIQRDFALIGSVKYEDLSETRSAINVPTTTKEPVHYTVESIDLGVAKAFNRIRLGANYYYRQFNYDDAVDASDAVFDQDFRDRKTHLGAVKLDYAVSPDTAVFVELRADRRRYRVNSNPSRDSDGNEVNLGLDFEPSQKLRGQFRVGYLNQSYANSAIKDTASTSYSGQIQWLVTGLTNVSFNVARQISDSGIVSSPTVLTTSGGVQIDHELLRNLILTGRVDYSTGDFSGDVLAQPTATPPQLARPFDRTDNRTSASLGGVYLLNSGVGLGILYTYLDQESSGQDAGNKFTSNRLSVSLVLQY